MQHQRYNKNFKFVEEPVKFDKNTDREFLQYCVGAVLYMPATRDFREAILTDHVPGLTSMVMCFEDAIDEKDIPEAEKNVLQFLHFVDDKINSGELDPDNVPLIFLRVRSIDQYDELLELLDEKAIKILTGFVFPKFNSINGEDYFSRLTETAEKYDQKLYGMPILEGREIAYKENRISELIKVKGITDKYKDYVLNIRLGGTDFSSCFGVRRGIDYTIYDVMPVRDCILDILNVFERENSYVVSGPVWEYFLANKNMKFENIPEDKFQYTLLTRTPLVNSAVDGLLREVIIDKANGIIGKTCIHPTHIRFVNGMQAVTLDEYNDACQILNTSGGVVKSKKSNKMNEVKPHTSWAKKIYARAKAYGVIENENQYLQLFSSAEH
ncbi:MAG: HpcH/HpaI aldolase/citrate lyase family protein [Eubacterium sp.]|nr:HpcH/HpaI aldolase/citrate lyase family protein [Eubacterium sp.]